MQEMQGGHRLSMAARLRQKYHSDIIPSLTKAFAYKNVMQVPKLEKIIVHVTMGEATQNIKLLDAAAKEIAAITGQKALVTKSKKAIAGFKLKENVPLGCKVTLRGDRMFEFLDRLISVALPRIRDFRGLSTKSFDGRGNYSFGLKEQYIFPEIDYDKVEMVHGLDINICTSAKTDEESRALLKEFGMPFRR
jgi:large subunit ribosomal protein L5